MPSSEKNDKLQNEILQRQISDQKSADKAQSKADANRNNPLLGGMGNDPSTKNNLRD